MVELLLQRGAKPVASPASPHALHLAARNGHVPVLTLLARSLLADEPDVDGRTALHYAAAALAVPPDPPHEWRAAEALLLKSLNSVCAPRTLSHRTPTHPLTNPRRTLHTDSTPARTALADALAPV